MKEADDSKFCVFRLNVVCFLAPSLAISLSARRGEGVRQCGGEEMRRTGGKASSVEFKILSCAKCMFLVHSLFFFILVLQFIC